MDVTRGGGRMGNEVIALSLVLYLKNKGFEYGEPIRHLIYTLNKRSLDIVSDIVSKYQS